MLDIMLDCLKSETPAADEASDDIHGGDQFEIDSKLNFR